MPASVVCSVVLAEALNVCLKAVLFSTWLYQPNDYVGID